MTLTKGIYFVKNSKPDMVHKRLQERSFLKQCLIFVERSCYLIKTPTVKIETDSWVVECSYKNNMRLCATDKL